MSEKIVVSVLVLTYNSEIYILETLESIRKQSYSEVELIISDDNSNDNTVSIIEEWLIKNKNRFIRVEIVTSNINTGITKNMNRGILHCQGVFIKPIAGDDLMLENCLEDMTSHMISNDLKVLYSRIRPFYDNKNNEIDFNNENEMYSLFELDTKQQYRKLLKSFSIYTIGIQFSRQFIVSMGLFDEKYTMMEDYPLALKITSMGYKLNFLDKYTMKYRVRPKSSRSVFLKSRRNKAHYSDLRKFESDEIIPRLKHEKMYISLYDIKIRRLAVKIENMSSGLHFVVIGRVIRLFILDNWVRRVKRCIRKFP